LSVPVLVAVCLVSDSISNLKLRNISALFLVFGGVLLVSAWGLNGKDADYLRLTWPSKVAMRLFRGSYFPHREIFCERVQAEENCNFDRAYVFGSPGQVPIRVLAEKKWIVQRCAGQQPIELPIKVETDGTAQFLWYSGTVTCPSGFRVDAALR
jgi:hypothetical protein